MRKEIKEYFNDLTEETKQDLKETIYNYANTRYKKSSERIPMFDLFNEITNLNEKGIHCSRCVTKVQKFFREVYKIIYED